MRKPFLATCAVALSMLMLVAAGTIPHGYAQMVNPVGSEFDTSSQAPFTVLCAVSATPPCPDGPSNSTYNINGQSPGQLRIYTLFGSLLGTSAQASNNARNMFLQPVSSGADYTLTTKLTFPANVTSLSPAGQTAGILVRQDDDNFIYVARVFTNGQARLEFLQETNGVDVSSAFVESSVTATVYLRVVKSGTTYQGFYSFDNVNFVAIPAGAPVATATATISTTPTGTPTVTPATVGVGSSNGYVAAYSSPSVGLFAYGGNQNTAVNTNPVAADFDWFRVGTNSMTPAPTIVPTATNTAVATSTGTAAPTRTATAMPTSTSVPTATATNTAIPTPTPQPTPTRPKRVRFKYISLWYHTVREGTYDHLEVQANLKTRLGIWVHVYFPSGKHFDYFENTTNKGHWSKQFDVPRGTISKHSNQALITFRLWHGSDNRKEYINFTIVR